MDACTRRERDLRWFELQAWMRFGIISLSMHVYEQTQADAHVETLSSRDEKDRGSGRGLTPAEPYDRSVRRRHASQVTRLNEGRPPSKCHTPMKRPVGNSPSWCNFSSVSEFIETASSNPPPCASSNCILNRSRIARLSKHA
jgi:hypothetical protein